MILYNALLPVLFIRILEKEKSERDKPLDMSTLQREVEKLKSAASRPSSASGSPSRRVWPVLAHPKNW